MLKFKGACTLMYVKYKINIATTIECLISAKKYAVFTREHCKRK